MYVYSESNILPDCLPDVKQFVIDKENYCNDIFQFYQLLLSVVQLVYQLVELLTHLVIPY